jgi:hypothetical protein
MEREVGQAEGVRNEINERGGEGGDEGKEKNID